MIRGENFICLGNNMWESNFTNTVVELMQILSRENNVLYVDYEFTLKDAWDSLRGKRAAPVMRMFGFYPRLRKVKTRFNSTIHVLTPPPVLPLNGVTSDYLFQYLLRINGKLVEREISTALSQLEIRNPIVISGFNPYYGNLLAGKLNEKLHVYYCYDEIDAGWHKKRGPEIEKEYMLKTDLVITTSEHLYHKKQKHSHKCHLIKNGVDFASFNKYSFNENRSLKTTKVIGYTGSIDSRFDIDTVEFLIDNLKDYQFIFAGRVTNAKAYEALKKYSNVKLLGSKKPEEIPAIVGDIDLGIVPYIKNHLTQGVYPLKFNEYLATGKPVVSTDFAVLSEFNGVVNFTSSKEEFLNAIKYELENDNETRQLKRIQFAEKNSWINRASEFSSILKEELSAKKQSFNLINSQV